MNKLVNKAVLLSVVLLLVWLLFGWVAYRAKPVVHWVLELDRESTRTVLRIGHDSDLERVAQFIWKEENGKEGVEKIIIDRDTRIIPFSKLESIDVTTLPGQVSFTLKEVRFDLTGHSVRMRGFEYDLSIAPVVKF